ncbi:FAD-dependent monooxygenase [Pseudonocardia sichuanensis]
MGDRNSIPFLIIGGGIGGLATALALGRRGNRVHVMERAPEFGEIGAGLQIAPNASRVLDSLGILESVTRDAFFPERLVMMDAVTGEEITAIDTGPSFVERFGYPYCVTHRADLLQALLDAARDEPNVTLEPSKEVTSVETTAGGARVTCADGMVYDADALVGADGLHSVTRRSIVEEGEPVCPGYVAYRGTIPMEDMRSKAGLRELKDMVIWTGPSLHLVQYPVRRGALCNQVAVFESAAYRAGAEVWGTAEELDRTFAGMCPEVTSGVAVMDRSRRWPLFDRPPIDNWTRDHVTLLGDAAHPMLQYLAQGACQALEDAVALAGSVHAHGGDVDSAFKAYQAERQPRTARVQTTARMFGEVLHIGGVGASMRTALLRQRAQDDYNEFDWLYAYTTPRF